MRHRLSVSWPPTGSGVTVTCRVLNIARQPYYRWLAAPVTDTELNEAYLANALFDAHRDDPSVRWPVPGRRGPRRWPHRV